MRSATHQLKLLLGLTGLLLFSACQKQDDYSPNNGQIAYINFYNAADGLLQNGAISGIHRIYINNPLSKGRIPEFLGTDDFRQYPFTITGTNLAVDNLSVPSDVTYNVVYWLPLKTDKYRFFYNSISVDNTSRGTITNMNTELKSESFTTQYLTESLQSDTSYQVLNVPVERSGIPGKVRIQVVNLSPDLGSLEVYREDSNSTKINEGLPATLASGAYSLYTELDTAGAYKNLGQLLLKIRKAGSKNALFTASVPAIPKSSFTVVVQGFVAQTTRRIKSIQSSTAGFVQVTVAPNLRLNIRRVY